jgi:hypothetical protein
MMSRGLLLAFFLLAQSVPRPAYFQLKSEFNADETLRTRVKTYGPLRTAA